MAHLARGTNPFPLRNLKTAVVIGDGDPARVAAEALLGYGTGAGKTVHSLDRVDKVFWVGQKAATREEFLSCERPRYHLLGLEFPRGADSPSGARGGGRIAPVPERAARFTVEDGKGVVTTRSGQRITGDAVIDCTGFGAGERGIPVPLSALDRPLRAGSRLRLCDATGDQIEFRLTCRSITGQPGNRALRRYEGTLQRYIGRVPVFPPADFSTPYCAPEEAGAALEAAAIGALNLPPGQRLYLQPTVLPVVYATTTGVRRPVARQEAGERVYYAGPQAGLPVPEGTGDKKEGREDAVALWRYAELVTCFAEYYFASLAPERGTPEALTPVFAPLVLPRVAAGEKTEQRAVAPIPARFGTGIEGDTRRLLRYLAGEHLLGFRLPAGATAATKAGPLLLHFLPHPKTEGVGSRTLEARAEGELLRRVDFRPLLSALVSDAMIQQIAAAWGFPTAAFERAGRARTITLSLVPRHARLRLQEIFPS